MILNVNQNEYVPFVTEAAGVRIKIHDPQRIAFLNNGHTLPTGFEIDVALSLVRSKFIVICFSVFILVIFRCSNFQNKSSKTP